ncbi:uncharacterized protein LOC128160465 isoform X2 [Crassostrea angulata]|uniref:uncharacterized protein LOC128160465 isoform X2 n=1 Tax=Magallana angulata TaxID=2784310 RepID=UPI0022B10804|nr:uncharacterized protein LOC128160465 isoform X2 [Crassostrea angulata]
MLISYNAGILAAKSCYFLKKTFTSDWDFNRLQDGLNQISSSTPYRTTLSSVYCSYDEVCCGQSCCPDPSVTPQYYYDTYNYQYYSSDDDSDMSFFWLVGLVFVIGLIGTGLCLLVSYVMKQGNQQNMTVRNVHPVVADSSDNGAVIIRQAPGENPSPSSTRGNTPPSYESENISQNSEPPPSYEYVMSHNYLPYTGNKSDSA